MDDQQTQILVRKSQITMQLILVCASTLGIFALMAALVFLDIPDKSKDIFSNALMMILTAWVGIIAYFFSTSISSANKDNKPSAPQPQPEKTT